MPTEEFKAKLFSLLAEEPTTDLRALASEWGVDYPLLSSWRTEYAAAVREGNHAVVVDLDAEVLAASVGSDVRYEPTAAMPSREELVGDVVEAGRGVSKLDALQDKTQLTALRLVDRITGMASFVEEPRDIKLLTSALSEIHSAFFNQRNTQIAVINQGGGDGESGEGGVKRFRSLMGA